MKAEAYLAAVKKQLDLRTDRQLEEQLEIGYGNIVGMKKGYRAIPNHVAFRIAKALNLEPARVIADLEEQREKNEKRRAFWQSVLSRTTGSHA
ncbi:MAG: hypothetical protein LBV49_07495 [Azonexus sp.]|jgi:hypothetical protein|nr:hypothetical protein [Azonexus sp.]